MELAQCIRQNDVSAEKRARENAHAQGWLRGAGEGWLRGAGESWLTWH